MVMALPVTPGRGGERSLSGYCDYPGGLKRC
jgi:hypothetical protein